MFKSKQIYVFLQISICSFKQAKLCKHTFAASVCCYVTFYQVPHTCYFLIFHKANIHHQISQQSVIFLNTLNNFCIRGQHCGSVGGGLAVRSLHALSWVSCGLSGTTVCLYVSPPVWDWQPVLDEPLSTAGARTGSSPHDLPKDKLVLCLSRVSGAEAGVVFLRSLCGLLWIQYFLKCTSAACFVRPSVPGRSPPLLNWCSTICLLSQLALQSPLFLLNIVKVSSHYILWLC